MKLQPEYVEGTEAWTRVTNAMKQVVSVPHEEIRRRIEQEPQEAVAKPNKRGPKPKAKQST